MATQRFGPVDNRNSSISAMAALPLTSVRFTQGFWQRQQTVNHRASLHHGYNMLKQNGAFYNFQLCAKLITGEFRRPSGHDTDVYKWLEAVAWDLAHTPDDVLLQYANEAIGLIEAAQAEDGYLNVANQLLHPDRKWADMSMGHEMYAAGHLIQAAVAVHRALGDDRLLKVACRFADHINSLFGPGKRKEVCGHPEIETAMVELYRETKEIRYLQLAQCLVDARGQKRMTGWVSYGPEYQQDHAPVRDAHAAIGHAVRQMYLATGVTDLYMETGETALFDAMQHLWKDVTDTKLHITGGVGARFEGEAFGDPYELPNDQCYCETCAAIGNVMWNWRMLLITGESRYADLIEQSLYNAILCSPALDGAHYFYVNPLMLRSNQFLRLSTNRPDSDDEASGRPAWHGVACCPPNVMRLIASIGSYFASQDALGIQLHQYGGMQLDINLPSKDRVRLGMEADFPWNGDVSILVNESPASPWCLKLRVPGWCGRFALSVNGQIEGGAIDEKGYLQLTRTWQPGDHIQVSFEMPSRLIVSNPRVDATRGCAAITRGPLVYCLESHDQEPGMDMLDLQVDPKATLEATWVEDLLGGVVVIRTNGFCAAPSASDLYRPLLSGFSLDQRPARLTAIPYFVWGNRGLQTMRVWVPIAR